MKAKVLGMKASKGSMDNGQPFDSTKIYVETRLDESKGTQKGYAVAEYNFGLSDEFNKFKHLPFPLMAEIELEQITNGKTVKTICVSMQPLNLPKQAA
jgi:hypothetical protein